MSVCRHGAIQPTADLFMNISQYKYKVVIPSPVFYTQFDAKIHPYIIHKAFEEIGFDAVYNVSRFSSALTRALVIYLRNYRGRLPIISSHCPSLVRLIQVKYPVLLELLDPLNVPREMAAREVRETFSEKHGLKPMDVGIIYVAPCPAQVVSIQQPAEKVSSWFDGVLSIKDVYSAIYPHIISLEEEFDESMVPEDFNFTTGWAVLGSITQEAEMGNWLAVSGLYHVMKIFDDIENSRLRNVEFVEALVCMLGCIGGPFNIENPYVARANCMKQKAKYETKIELDDREIEERLKEEYYFLENDILPRPTKFFDTDLETSIKRIKERERVYKKLRQIDCGCCGAPTCMTFAEDFAKGEVKLTDCIFLAERSDRLPIELLHDAETEG
jgi:iron only hydrogenase large subunit-like protein